MKTEVIIIGLATLLLAGCLEPASKINNVSVGMSRTQVVQIMGTPVSVTSDGTATCLNYSLAEGSRNLNGPVTPYEVRIVDDKVVSYGRAGATKMGAPYVVPPVVTPVK